MPALLEIEDLSVTFAGRRRLLTPTAPTRAVRHVDLVVRAGETVGLVGESGSGKTTLARAVLGLVTPESGEIRLDGREINWRGRKSRKALAGVMQMVFQDPTSSLNPSMTVGGILREAIKHHRRNNSTDTTSEANQLLASVRMSSEISERFPGELSGGQRQRVAIARALAARPRLLVCDEPLSALDISTQAEIINLLRTLQRERELAMLFIGHDLAVIRHISDRVGVMYRGRIEEFGPAESLSARPEHPYTALLIGSAPQPDPHLQQQRRLHRSRLQSESGRTVPDAGCPYAPRCEYQLAYGITECLTEFPPSFEREAEGSVACYMRRVAPGVVASDFAARVPDTSSASSSPRSTNGPLEAPSE